MKTIELKYGNTNTFYIEGDAGGLLVDTDYADTLFAFYKAIKAAGIRVTDIRYVLATHYHPDHCGLVSELIKQGVQLLLPDVQKESIHYSDAIFARDGLSYTPVDAEEATVISCTESRAFLAGLGIAGQIVHTPSHSPDSVSLVLESGDCFVGDLEPPEYIPAYEENAQLKADWEQILASHPKRLCYAHRPAQMR